MGYQPSINDLPQEYIPSLGDIHEAEGLTSNPYANYLAAGLTGTLKGVGEIPYRAASLFSKALSKLGGPQLDVANPFDVETYKNMSPVANALAQNQEANPLSSNIGSFGGSTAALLPIGFANIFGTGATGLGKLAQFVGNNAAQGIASTGLLNPNANAGEYAAGAISAPLLSAAGSILPNAISRVWNTTGARADDLSSIASGLYNNVYNVADRAGYKTIPNNYEDYVNFIKNKMNNASGIANKLSDNTKDIINTADKDIQALKNGRSNPNAFSLEDTHDQMQTLGSEIEKLNRTGDSYNKSVVTKLRNALMSDIEPSVASTNSPDLTNKFFNTQKFYRDNVVPVKENPTSRGGTLTELLTAKALAGMPEPIAVGAGAAAGEAGLLNRGATVNAFKRYFSPMQGGPSSILSDLYNPYTQTVGASLLPQLLQRGNNQ